MKSSNYKMMLQIKIALLLIFTAYASVTIELNLTKADKLIQQFLNIESESNRIKFLQDSIKPEIDKLEKAEALTKWEELIEVNNKMEYFAECGECCYYKAASLKNAGDYYSAYNSYNESKIYYETSNYKPGLAKVENGLGILYKELNYFEKSIEHYNEGAKLYTELKDSIRVGWIYLNMGGMWEKRDSLKIALYYLRKSRYLLEKLQDPNIISCYINIGEVFNDSCIFDSAYYYYLKGYELSKIKGDPEDKFQAPYHLAEFLFFQKRIYEATPILMEVKEYAESQDFKNMIKLNDRSDFAVLLSKFYEQQKDYVNALNALKESSNPELENKREESILKLNRLEFEKAESDTKRERNRRLWTMYISIAGLLGSLLIMIAFYRSYKHKKEANRLLTEMDELKNRLFSNITHELRTPLTLILGPLEQMLSSETDKAPTHKQVKMMRKNANSLLNLVNQMLDLTKIDAKSMKLELVEEDINKFLRTRFAAFASLADQKSITYMFSLLNEKNIRVFDASKLEKIINNLVSNAVKFTEKNGKINCFANFNQPNMLELIVQDDGKGIPKDELHSIFDRFHQVKPTDEMINLGTGIGLSLTKELIELMHGKISVESEVGRGSKFIVNLPLGTAHLNTDEFQMIQNLHSKNHKNSEFTEPLDSSDDGEILQEPNNGKESFPHVLIIEDHADIREFIAENLKDNFFVEMAENGKKGLDIAIKHIPDLVITDIVMPEMDGIELCSNLKTDQRTSHIPVVMLTGKSGIDDRLKGLETGADAYLTKPFNIKELRLQVTKLIEQRQKLRERFTRDLRLEPKDIAVTSADEKFINRAMEIIEKNIGNSDFEVRQFEEEMFMSRMQLFRKIKALTNQTPGDFIRTIRLKRAASLIKQNFGNIAQITYEVGFNNPSYFAKCFKDLYGVLPSDYMKNH